MTQPPEVRVTLPAALLALFPGCPAQHRLRADTVEGVVYALDAAWPGMRARLCDGRPALRQHIAVYVGEERATLDTTVPPGADLSIMTAISGG